MKLIKKSEKLLLDKIKTLEEEEEQSLQADADTLHSLESLLEDNQQLYLDNQELNYIPSRDNPIVRSVGNSGWQVSDIWKDVRVDTFCS
ncbi:MULTISPECIES: hypothetical protein [unclassified Anabaena]|uniref:hypothetical protein n=1 Tax=unclassified Anabaena TaxID=2619674 RepID=UPI0039C7551B